MTSPFSSACFSLCLLIPLSAYFSPLLFFLFCCFFSLPFSPNASLLSPPASFPLPFFFLFICLFCLSLSFYASLSLSPSFSSLSLSLSHFLFIHTQFPPKAAGSSLGLGATLQLIKQGLYKGLQWVGCHSCRFTHNWLLLREASMPIRYTCSLGRSIVRQTGAISVYHWWPK